MTVTYEVSVEGFKNGTPGSMGFNLDALMAYLASGAFQFQGVDTDALGNTVINFADGIGATVQGLIDADGTQVGLRVELPPVLGQNSATTIEFTPTVPNPVHIPVEFPLLLELFTSHFEGGYFGISLTGTPGRDVATGTLNDDVFVGLRGADIFHGGAGNDLLRGGRGNDQLFGGPGNDLIIGGRGHDRMDGGEGNDVIVSGSGRDTISGGPGSDVFLFASRVDGGRGRSLTHVEDFGAGDVFVFSESADLGIADAQALGNGIGDPFVSLQSLFTETHSLADLSPQDLRDIGMHVRETGAGDLVIRYGGHSVVIDDTSAEDVLVDSIFIDEGDIF